MRVLRTRYSRYTLDERRKRALRLRYGLETGELLSYREVGAAMGVSTTRAGVLILQALDLLQLTAPTPALVAERLEQLS